MSLIVNLYGAPGVGKSTTAAGVFYELKTVGINAEYVTEVAKDFTWEKRDMALGCQPYVFGKQLRDVLRVIDQVEVVITDSPLFLSAIYAEKYPNRFIDTKTFIPFVVNTAKQIGGINYFVTRVKDYNPKGRNQTEQESDELSIFIQNKLVEHDISFRSINGNSYGVADIVYDVKHILGHKEFNILGG